MQPLLPSICNSFPLLDLPDLALLRMLSFLDPCDVKICASLCRTLRYLSNVCTHSFAVQSRVFSREEIEIGQPLVHAKVLRVIKCAKNFFPTIPIDYAEFAVFLTKKNLEKELSCYLNVEEQPIELVKILLKCGAQSDAKNLCHAIRIHHKELVESLLDSRDPHAPWYKEGMVKEFRESKVDTVAIVKNYDLCHFALRQGTLTIFKLVVEKTLGSIEAFENLIKDDDSDTKWVLENRLNRFSKAEPILYKINKNVVILSQAINACALQDVQYVLKDPIWDKLQEIEENQLDSKGKENKKNWRYELCCYALTHGTSEIFLFVLHRLFASVEEFAQKKFEENFLELMEKSLMNLLPKLVTNYRLRKRWTVIDESIKEVQEAIRLRDPLLIKKLMRKREVMVPRFVKANLSSKEWQILKQSIDYDIGCFALLESTAKIFLGVLQELNLSLKEFIHLVHTLVGHEDRKHKILYILTNTEDAVDPERMIEENAQFFYAETEVDEKEEGEEEAGLDVACLRIDGDLEADLEERQREKRN